MWNRTNSVKITVLHIRQENLLIEAKMYFFLNITAFLP